MTIRIEKNGSTLLLAPEGRLDTLTAPQLEAAVKENLADAASLTFDFEKLEYVSSAGLRVMHSTHKRVRASKTMLISHATGTVLDIFESTGFSAFLNLI